jgi:hypothetical protein
VGQAHNHPWGCGCNWCNNYAGKGGGGRRTVAVSSPLQAQSLVRAPSVEEAQTVRTRCPRCGDEVWFHRAWNGGCAWFDRLGQPWDIHDCFKDDARPRPRTRSAGVTDELSAAVGPSLTAALARQGNWDQAQVVELVEGAAGGIAAMLWMPAQQVLLPMLVTNDGVPALGAGWARLTARSGVIEFSKRPTKEKRLRLVGPAHDCWDRSVWLTGKGEAQARLALGRDLGLRRHEHFAKDGVRYTAPRWREALSHYLPALFDGDEEAMAEAVRIIDLPARGVLPQADERSLVQVFRSWGRCSDKERRAGLYEKMLELIRL